MQNIAGDIVDMYIPRKCSATNRVITGKDHAAVQINVGKVDENGLYTGEHETIALCGFVRGKGLADDAINRIVKQNELLADVQPE